VGSHRVAGERAAPFARLLATPGVEEVFVPRGRFGFMAFHGGALEEITDVIAGAAAAAADASYYGVHQPADLQWHIPSSEIDPAASPALAAFLEQVDHVVTVHGYGRAGLWSTLLLGGRNRELAAHVGHHLRRHLPVYEVETDLAAIPAELRGLHPRNPVNLVRGGGTQLELPPRVRGTTPMFWDWEGPELNPHTQAVVDALAEAARSWMPLDEGSGREALDHPGGSAAVA